VTEEQATRWFYDLVWPHRADILRLAQLLTRNPAEADDLAQETFLKAFRKVDRFQPGTDVKRWLLAILRNIRVDRLRAAGSKPMASLDELTADAAVAEETEIEVFPGDSPQGLLDAFSDQQVIEALQKLPEEIRWTLLLVDIDGMSQQEASEVLDVPVGTIKSRVHRGHLMLRDGLLPVARDRRLVRE
jgi:RNA polymerase sigma-70 factor, ECF subfamily